MMETIVETIFRSSSLVALSLVVGGLVMLLAEKNATKFKNNPKILSGKRGLLIGCFQSLALIPGFSRSGMTISGGLVAGLSREEAARFAFLLAFPVLLGSGMKKLLDLYQLNLLNDLGGSLIAGSVIAFLVGLAAIHFLITFLKKHKLYIFVWYRFILAVVVLILL